MTSDLDVVVAGGGRVGVRTARMLADHGHDVTIIERDDDVVAEIADAWMATVIAGDATNPDILEQADVEGADVVAGLAGESGTNLAVCMAAERLSPGVRTVARIESESAESYMRLVDAVVFPERAGARVATNEILGSDVQSMADMVGDVDVLLVRVASGAPAAGKSLGEVRFPTGALVVADENGDRIVRPDSTLEAGKQYVVAVEPAVADEVMNLLRG